jgi:hypothetical protein
MKNLCALLFTFTVLCATGQEYKTAFGIKGGYPGFGSLNAKHFLSENTALEASFGPFSRENYGSGVFLIADYEIQNSLESHFSWYYGGGGLMGFTSNGLGTSNIHFGINTTVGLEYTFEDLPINCSINTGPIIFITPLVELNWGGGLAIRYAIR